MTPFTTLTSIVAPLLRDDVDTDTIIPSHEMRTTGRSGLADGLFAPWRYLQARTPDPRFVLNQPEFAQAMILAAGRNFGCGSSREHAVWALAEWGIRAVVAESFAPIFRNNCIRNGVLPVELDKGAIEALAGSVVAIDLPRQTIATQGSSWSFGIDDEAKAMLVEGLDAIDLTLKQADAIAAFHARDRVARPWVYLEAASTNSSPSEDEGLAERSRGLLQGEKLLDFARRAPSSSLGKKGLQMPGILISEVGPRDGLQSVGRIMPLEAKKAWIAAEAAAGVREIEVGSFVPPSLLPQLADTAEVVAFARTIPDLNVVALVPNARGAERAVAAGVHAVSTPFSMSESHSLNNVRKSHAQMLAEIGAIAAIAAGAGVHFAVGLSTAFGCTIEGSIPDAQIVRLAEAAMHAGAAELSLSDTTGYANPAQVRRLIRAVRAAVGDALTTLHLHNTRGLGLANVLAGLDEGITTFDASLGGLGGCPFAPGASGNIVTEDLVFMLEAMGVPTGIDLDKLVAVRAIVAEALPGEPLYGFMADAGAPLGFTNAAAA